MNDGRNNDNNSSVSRGRDNQAQIRAGPLYSNEKKTVKGRKMRAAQSNGFNQSDASDNEMYSSMHKRSVGERDDYNRILASGRNSDPNLLNP